MSYNNALPIAFVDVYPFELDSFSLPQASLLTVSVNNIVGGNGTFEINIIPGGPNGPDVPPSWAQVITPMSLVVIGMERGKAAQITMVGVVRTIGESTAFRPGEAVRRSIRITGDDFGYFFTMFTWYSLWYLGAQGVGGQLPGQPPSSALPQILGAAYLTGDPGDIGDAWFNGIMGGEKGVLSNTYVPYQGTQVSFSAAMEAFFGKYDVTVPYGEYFVAAEGAWLDKFKMIFPFPWYELFTITAYDPNLFKFGDGVSTPGFPFSSTGMASGITAVPMVVARKNPLPQLTSGFACIDRSRWDSLPLFFLESGFLDSSVGYNESQVNNFYTLNPTWMRTLFGGPTDTNIPFLFAFGSAADTNSIQRYGFRPANASFNWMTNFTDKEQLDKDGLSELVATLLARFASYWEPTPLMLNGTVTTWLRPDILPGCRFTYQPYKNGPFWDFYITSVNHTWVMGGPSTTSLGIARGLPSNVYQDDALLTAVHSGNAEVLNGVYQTRSGGASGLTPLGLEQFQSFLASIGPPYLNAQVP